MIRIRLLTSCWASPLGTHWRGAELDVDDRQAEMLIASQQAVRVLPPPLPLPEAPAAAAPDPAEAGDWTTAPAEAAAAENRPKREYRKKQP